ncbi:MAG: fatty-acid--CoA ligase, partial [Hyphomicrobiales bacterium]
MNDLPAAALPSTGPGQILPFAAARHPEKVGLVVGDRRLTYRELDRLSDDVATSLRHRGIGAGDVVSLYGQNSWEWIVSYHGALKAGAVINPVNVMLTGPELSYVLGDCNAKVVFAGPGQVQTAAGALATVSSVELFCVFDTAGDAPAPQTAVPWTEFLAPARGMPAAPTPEVAPKDLCCIGYTSGTTGHPKGAMQTHQAVLLNCALTATMHGRRDDDIVVTALPAAHVYGNVA